MSYSGSLDAPFRAHVLWAVVIVTCVVTLVLSVAIGCSTYYGNKDSNRQQIKVECVKSGGQLVQDSCIKR